MRIQDLFAAASLAAVTAFPVPAFAQAAAFDAAQISAACATSACGDVVSGLIRKLQLTLSPAELNAQLAILASIVIQAAKDNPAIAQHAGLALKLLAAASTDAAQGAAIQRVASIVGSGGAGGLDIGTPVAGSSS